MQIPDMKTFSGAWLLKQNKKKISYKKCDPCT